MYKSSKWMDMCEIQLWCFGSQFCGYAQQRPTQSEKSYCLQLFCWPNTCCSKQWQLAIVMHGCLSAEDADLTCHRDTLGQWHNHTYVSWKRAASGCEWHSCIFALTLGNISLPSSVWKDGIESGHKRNIDDAVARLWSHNAHYLSPVLWIHK